MKVSRWYPGVTLSIIMLALFCFGCGMFEMDSRWRDRDIVIDGIDNDDEWEMARYYFEEKQITVGIMNDADNLYVRLSTRDVMLQSQILMGGLTLWFAEDGGKGKTLGLHFPMGGQIAASPDMQSGSAPGRQRGSMPGMQPSTGMPGTMTSPGEAAAMLNNLLSSVGDEMEIIGPGKHDRVRLNRYGAQKTGIDCTIAATRDILVYEMRIPLRRTGDHPYGISAGEAPAIIGIGCETAQMAMNQPDQDGRSGHGGADSRMQGGMAGGMPQGMDGGNMSGGRRGAGGMPGVTQTGPLELWMKTYLAAPE